MDHHRRHEFQGSDCGAVETLFTRCAHRSPPPVVAPLPLGIAGQHHSDQYIGSILRETLVGAFLGLLGGLVTAW